MTGALSPRGHGPGGDVVCPAKHKVHHSEVFGRQTAATAGQIAQSGMAQRGGVFKVVGCHHIVAPRLGRSFETWAREQWWQPRTCAGCVYPGQYVGGDLVFARLVRQPARRYLEYQERHHDDCH